MRITGTSWITRGTHGATARRLAIPSLVAAALLLSSCQFGGQQAPTGDDIDKAAKDETSQVESNAGSGQGGAVVSAGNEGSGEEGQNASTKTTIDDLWMLDEVQLSNGETLYDSDDVLYYGTTYEIVCAAEFYKEGDDQLFACALPGIDLVGEWAEKGETEATLTIPSDNGDLEGSFAMSDDRQTATLTLPAIDGNAFVCQLHRDDDTTITLDSMYEGMVKNNDEFFNGLEVEEEQDVTFVDDDKLTMRLLGRLKQTENGMTGYLLEVTNKTTEPLIINDFSGQNGEGYFKINGAEEPVKALTGRVLPPLVDENEEDDEVQVAPMKCAILLSSDSFSGDLTSCVGNLLVTDYHWTTVGTYPFTVGL